MNVILITADSNVLREGSVAQATVLRQARAATKLIVIVLASRRERFEPRRLNDSLWLIPVNSAFRFLAPFSATSVIRRELYFQGRLQADLISAQDAGMSGVAAWLAARAFRRPLHLHLDIDVFSRAYKAASLRNRLRALLARFLVDQSRALHVASEGIRASIADVSTALLDRTTVSQPFVDVAAFQQEPLRVDLRAKYPQFKFVILSVAPLVRAHNLQLALSVLAGVLREYPHAGLVIVGEGSMRWRLRWQAYRLGLSDRVIFEPWTDNLSSYFRTAHAFLSTSLYEEYDHVITKAAASSSAIVTTRVGIAAAIITDGVSGYLCDPADPPSFVRALLSMIRDPNARERLRVNGMLAVERYMAAVGDNEEESYRESWERALEGIEPLR